MDPWLNDLDWVNFVFFDSPWLPSGPCLLPER
jgi:hypothetical protein